MSNKRYWTSLEEYRQEPEALDQARKEFPEDPFDTVINGEGFKTSRRDFLKMMGFGLTAATLVACQESPVRYALPYVNQPVDVVPGVANWYASTFFDGLDYCSVLVKTREGRPIKIEGNQQSGVSHGGTSVRAQAHILGLYDNDRLKTPEQPGKGEMAWGAADRFVTRRLNKDSKIAILSRTILSPSTRALIGDFQEQFPNTDHVAYDSVSSSALMDAHREAFGKRVLPRYHFDQADYILGINADFLGSWLNTTEYNHDYAQNRRLTKGKRTMSRHVQLESTMSLSGANADLRLPIKPSHEGALVLRLYKLVVEKANTGGMELPGNALQKIAKELTANKGKALLVSGSTDPNVQLLIAAINEYLGSYGSTIDLDNPSQLRQGSDQQFAQLIRDLKEGDYDALFIYDTNPLFTAPQREELKQAMGKVPLKVAFGPKKDETAANCDLILPIHHPLESWNDAEPVAGHYSLQQPTIQPLFDTRQFQDSLLMWMGDDRDYYQYMRDHWQQAIYPQAGGQASAADNTAEGSSGSASFDTFWTNALHSGIVERPEQPSKTYSLTASLEPAIQAVDRSYGPDKGSEVELQLYTKVGIGDGKLADLPWLQEFPDPITKATWDNYLQVPPKLAEQLDLSTGDVVNVSGEGFAEELPVLVQPGLHPQVVAAALGYGRTHAGPAARVEPGAKASDGDGERVLGHTTKGGGVDVTPAYRLKNGRPVPFRGVSISKIDGAHYDIARTQIQGTAMTDHRQENVIKEKTLAEFAANPNEIKEERAELQKHLVNLYPDHVPKQGEHHRWAMAIDLNACTGCGACVVSCQAENNIPVVGKQEVLTGREMHWIRIDRYYSTSPEDVHDVKASEHPEDFPEVTFQPMLCQHCDNAPCENVCPVLATVHSDDGLNQQAYNRCFGTRYCANNCPYKVRRFNWFDYTNKDNWEYNPVDDLGRMVLNPDVTVRARGVMEKCSFCVQRIQEERLKAKKAGAKVDDNTMQTACSQSCPTGAIVFGDLNDPDSEVNQLINGEGHVFYVIEEVKTLPSIGYLAKVRNKQSDDQVVVS